MVKSFICNFFICFIDRTPISFIISVYFLFTNYLYAFEFQCYQKFISSKPVVLVKFKNLAQNLDFHEVNRYCIASTELKIHFIKNYKIIYEKQVSKTYYLQDYQDPSETWILDSLWIYQLDFGEYEVHFSVEQPQKAFYQKNNFNFENQLYRVNIHDIELFDQARKPVFNTINDSQDSLSLKFEFDSFNEFPLTIRLQILKIQPHQMNNYAIAYQSVYQTSSTINLKIGKNNKWIKVPIQNAQEKLFFEINFFEEENFVLSKRMELETLLNKYQLQKQYIALWDSVQKLQPGYNIQIVSDDETLWQNYMYLQKVLEKCKGNRVKLKTLLDLGFPDKEIREDKEIWVYYKYNRKVSF